jgi:hypothetical protein
MSAFGSTRRRAAYSISSSERACSVGGMSNSMAVLSSCDNLGSLIFKERIGTNEERIGFLCSKCSGASLNVARCACVKHYQL